MTRSRSMSSRARPASHLYVSTTLPPEIVAGCITQLQAVTWNRGVGAMNTLCAPGLAGGGGAGISPAAIAFCSAMPVAIVRAMMLRMLCTDPRWVSWAPLGKPVVPDV